MKYVKLIDYINMIQLVNLWMKVFAQIKQSITLKLVNGVRGI
ncbi:hypothetical protein SDC9_30481 [bioreactor metagenome]|uniref:Uncharacterized protein n=1 Tax=bioreactor metagenome TaxID=1076179 RepID=A0A644UZL8_9ZZZZ